MNRDIKIIHQLTNASQTITNMFACSPLDGDEVDIIADRFKAELNIRQGNITNEEYDNLECVKNWHEWYFEAEEGEEK